MVIKKADLDQSFNSSWTETNTGLLLISMNVYEAFADNAQQRLFSFPVLHKMEPNATIWTKVSFAI